MIPTASQEHGASTLSSWRIAPGLKVLSWGDSSGDVVFSAWSRTTCLVDAIGGAVLQALQQFGGKATLPLLLSQLQLSSHQDTSQSADAALDKQQSAALHACLQGLAQAGLVKLETADQA